MDIKKILLIILIIILSMILVTLIYGGVQMYGKFGKSTIGGLELEYSESQRISDDSKAVAPIELIA